MATTKQTAYVFLVKRQNESLLWPCVVSRALVAERFPGRASAVVGVTFDVPIVETPEADTGIPLE